LARTSPQDFKDQYQLMELVKIITTPGMVTVAMAIGLLTTEPEV